jgi:hypothetical protein
VCAGMTGLTFGGSWASRQAKPRPFWGGNSGAWAGAARGRPQAPHTKPTPAAAAAFRRRLCMTCKDKSVFGRESVAPGSRDLHLSDLEDLSVHLIRKGREPLVDQAEQHSAGEAAGEH